LDEKFVGKAFHPGGKISQQQLHIIIVIIIISLV
jgi:hypothetical protein